MATAQDGLISHWDFNGGSTEDRMGNNDGIIGGGPQIVDSPYGQGLVIDGDESWGGRFGGITVKRQAGHNAFYGLMMNGGKDALKWVVGATGKGEAGIDSATTVVRKGWMHVAAT